MKKPSPALALAPDRANDDIGEETRLALFRTQFEIREAEQRAYDLFLQNLVKGTSHLSLGQEAIAAGFAVAMKPGDLSFCTYRGHAHTLARGVPVEKVLGELMQRDNGLMRGKGGSMHLTSVEHGVMGSYAIIGAHLPIACGAALRAQYKGAGRRLGLLLRRRHHQYRRLPRGAQLRRGLEAAGRLRVREQSLHGIHADRRGDRGRASGRRSRLRLRPRPHRHRRQRRRRGLSHGAHGLRPRPRRRRSVADRVHDLPAQRPLARRPRQVPAARASSSEWKKHDPIKLYRERLKQFGIGEDAIAAIEADVRRGVDEATENCKAAPPPSTDILFTDVYADGGWAWRN